jgi:hypothetical protein
MLRAENNSQVGEELAREKRDDVHRGEYRAAVT